MDDNQRLELTERALDMALQRRRPTGLIDPAPRPRHPVHGGQISGKSGGSEILLSLSRPSMPYDNAMAESFFATLKLEIGHGKSFANRDAARTAVFEYVERFYNRIRMHSSLSYRSPMQAEREYLQGRSVS